MEVHPLVQAMTRGDWLSGYADIVNIDRALRGMARRARVAAGIGTAAEELARDYDALVIDVAEFFPELRAHCTTFLGR